MRHFILLVACLGAVVKGQGKVSPLKIPGIFVSHHWIPPLVVANN
jgi:hypothetical protein